MNNKVKFLRGTAQEYAGAVKDDDTFYYTTDDEKFYVGSKEITGGGITVDTALSNTSTNPVQNKVIKAAIDDKADKTTATKDTDGLMSASDKTKLDNADSTYALKSKYGDTTIDVGRKADSDVGAYSTAEGHYTTASGKYSHAEGVRTTASGDSSHAEGSNGTASGNNSHAEGYNTIASGQYSHAEGGDTESSGSSSHAEGYRTTASGKCSHAEGSNTDLSGISLSNRTVTISDVDYTIIGSNAYGINSHAEGTQSFAYGYSSHAEGRNTTASGNYSHTSGYYTKALHNNEAAYGKYNESNDNTLFSIGDGTADDARHNAFEITTDGGKLHDKDIATTDLIPTSLPANGGNADTVDGMHADNFIKSVIDINRTSLDDCVTGGTYAVSPVYTTDMPTQYGMWGICDVRVYGMGVYQIIQYTDTANVICRSKIVSQTDWTEWKEISTTPIKSVEVGGTTNIHGNFMIWKASSNRIPIYAKIAGYYVFPFLIFTADDYYYYLGLCNAVSHEWVADTAVTGTVYYIEI